LGRWLVVESRLQTVGQDRVANGTERVANGTERVANGTERGNEQEATSVGIAMVTRLVDVTWQKAEKQFLVGDALSVGVVGLDSGVAQIEFFCGATVILEGPARLMLESSTVARLQSGQLRAQVPPAARGFQIHADGLKVVDLGTEFGVAINEGEADVQVFDGEVELYQSNGEQRLVSAGNAVTHAANGVIEDAKLTPGKFLGLEGLDDRVRNQKQNRYQRWLDHSMELRKDPRVITYYSMEHDRYWKRKLASSVVPENRDLDGAIVGAKRVGGRWPQKSGIEFKRPGDRVRVNIPGQFGSLTFACWVKIDSLDRWYNSLFLTDNYQRGEPHWQILDTGQLFFSVRLGAGLGKGHHKVLSPPFWDASMSGRWLHLATTYDVETKTTTHFLNGEQLCQERIPDELFVHQTRFGKATIGNWSSPTRPEADFAIRNLNGSMDEFVLFRDALKPQEVRELFVQGSP
ncbi:FecR domain-containing protein, partial [bacterium]|nr:FecR domain-containing protein [bacterium]